MAVLWSLVDSNNKYDYYVGNNGTCFRRDIKTLVEYPIKIYLKNGIRALVTINRKEYTLKTLVAEHFIRGYCPGYTVKCVDGNPLNCREKNLRIYSQKENGQMYGWQGSSQKVSVDGIIYRSIRQAAIANYVDRHTLQDYIAGKYQNSLLNGKNVTLC